MKILGKIDTYLELKCPLSAEIGGTCFIKQSEFIAKIIV